MIEGLKKCQTCNHEIACNAWNRELCSADECYCETGDVTIYTRFTIGGEGCEYFQEAADENPPLTLEELKQMEKESVWVQMSSRSDLNRYEILGKQDAEYKIRFKGGGALRCEDYGKTWLAYKRKS